MPAAWIKKSDAKASDFLAAEEGFEPSQTESESAVLLLHNSAISPPGIPDSKGYCITKFPDCQAFFAKKYGKIRIFYPCDKDFSAKRRRASLAAFLRTAFREPEK